jgi:hypothetical protein
VFDVAARGDRAGANRGFDEPALGYTFQFSDSAGASDISNAQVYIGSGGPYCYFGYNNFGNGYVGLYLVDQYGGLQGPIWPGSGSLGDSSQPCSVSNFGYSWNGNQLIVSLTITYYSNFGSDLKNAMGYATSANSGQYCPWMGLGTWQDPTVPLSFYSAGMGPSSGQVPATVQLNFTFYDSWGASDISTGQVYIAQSLGATPNCNFGYSYLNGANGSPPLVVLYLVLDNGALSPAIYPGTGYSQSNATGSNTPTCTINSFGYNWSGDYLNIGVGLTFDPSFSGKMTVYSFCASFSDPGQNSGWAWQGSWSIITPVQVTVTTVPPAVQISVDNVACTTPCTYEWNPGDFHIFSPPDPLTYNNGQYPFGSWSNGIAQSCYYGWGSYGRGGSYGLGPQCYYYVYLPSSGPLTYTGTYGAATQYYLTAAASPIAGGTISPATLGWEPVGASVTFTETPAAGYQFNGYTFNGAAVSPPMAVNAPGTLTANFSPLPPDFTVSVSSGSPVLAGASLPLQVSVNALNGFTGKTTFAVTGLPAGATATFGPSPTGSGQTTMTIQTAAGVNGNFSFTVIATSGSLVHTAPAAISVQDYTWTLSPGSQSVPSGGLATFSISVTGLNGFTGAIAFSPGAAINGNCPRSPWTAAPFQSYPASVQAGSSANITLGPVYSAAGGNTGYTCTSICGDASHCQQANVYATNTPGFSLGVTTPTLTVTPPASASYTVTNTPSSGFSGTINLSATVQPANITASFNPTRVAPGQSSTMTVTVPAGTLAVLAQVTITGSFGTTSSTAYTSLNVAGSGFTIQAVPVSQAQSPPIISSGGSATYSVVVNSVNGFSGPVSLTSSHTPGGMTVSLSPTASSSQPATLTISSSSKIRNGRYAIPLTASAGAYGASAWLPVCGESCAPDSGFMQISSVDYSNPAIFDIYGGDFGSGTGFGAVVFNGAVPCSANPSSWSPGMISTPCYSQIPPGQYSVSVIGCDDIVEYSGECLESNDFGFSVSASPANTIDSLTVTQPATPNVADGSTPGDVSVIVTDTTSSFATSDLGICKVSGVPVSGCLVAVLKDSGTVSVTAANPNPSSIASQIRWDFARDGNDTVASDKPALNNTTGATTSFQPSTPGNFRLVAYLDTNGNGQFDEGEQLRVLRIAIVRVTPQPLSSLTTQNTLYGETPTAYAGVGSTSYPPAPPFPMNLSAQYLLEGGGQDKSIGTSGIIVGEVGNVINSNNKSGAATGDTFQVLYSTAGTGVENPGSPNLPMVDCLTDNPTDGAEPMRQNSNPIILAPPTTGGVLIQITSLDAPGFSWYVTQPNTKTTWFDTGGTVNFGEFVVAVSRSFLRTYLSLNWAQWSISIIGYNAGSNVWVDSGSSIPPGSTTLQTTGANAVQLHGKSYLVNVKMDYSAH